MWTKEKLDDLINDYPTTNTKELATRLEKSLAAVQIMAQRMGLRKLKQARVVNHNDSLAPWERRIDTGIISKQGNVTVHRML